MIIMMIRINCYRTIGRCEGTSPMLTKYNYLAGCRVQHAQPASGVGLERVEYKNVNPPRKPAPNPPEPGNPTGYPAPVRGVNKRRYIYI